MDESFVLVWLNACYAWLIWYTWLLQWRTVARPVNLAQASQSRLGEMKQGARPGLLHERSPRRPAWTLERGNTSPRREGSRLSEIPWCFLSAPSNPRPGEGGARLSEHVSPEPRPLSLSEGLSEAVRCLGCLLFLDDWYWVGCELYDEKHVYNGVLCVLGMNRELCMSGWVCYWHVKCVRGLELKEHVNDTRWGPRFMGWWWSDA